MTTETIEETLKNRIKELECEVNSLEDEVAELENSPCPSEVEDTLRKYRPEINHLLEKIAYRKASEQGKSVVVLYDDQWADIEKMFMELLKYL